MGANVFVKNSVSQTHRPRFIPTCSYFHKIEARRRDQAVNACTLSHDSVRRDSFVVDSFIGLHALMHDAVKSWWTPYRLGRSHSTLLTKSLEDVGEPVGNSLGPKRDGKVNGRKCTMARVASPRELLHLLVE